MGGLVDPPTFWQVQRYSWSEGGDCRMCDSRWEYWSFLRDKERREDEARRPVEVVDERDVPESEVEPEPEPERELVRA
jgi:hypothetical protein